MYCNLMYEEQLESLEYLKLKHRRKNQIIQTFCRIGSPPEIRGPPSLIRKNFKSLRRVLLYHLDSI